MIRTTREAAVFGLWRNPALLDALTDVALLTTARYEPIVRSALGTGFVDLLFERGTKSCVVGGIRLDPNSLVTHERDPLIWPAHIAEVVDSERLTAIAERVIPWLRSLARGRAMARETIRRFAPSERFDRARAAELLGAAPLERVMRRMAPFVYARRYAAGARVRTDCVDDALGFAVLRDTAASIYTCREAEREPNVDAGFARDWYDVPPAKSDIAFRYDISIADRRAHGETPVSIDTVLDEHSSGRTINVPFPVPQDVLFSFDVSDAPPMSRFRVAAPEPPLRACPAVKEPPVFGGSQGKIVLAMSAEALSTRDAVLTEVQTLARCLNEQGFEVEIAIDFVDPPLSSAALVHIFGSAYETHTVEFAQAARNRGIDFVLDVAPRPQSPSNYVETTLLAVLRAASDDAELARYLEAYNGRTIAAATAPEPSLEQYAQIERRFAELAQHALGILAAEEDLADIRASIPAVNAARVRARGVFASAEPAAAPIGHLVRGAPFAMVHGVIGARSHALFTALSVERTGVTLVIAGPCADVEYLQTLRTSAPNAIVLADADDGTLSALYRRATIWVDAAPRPRSAAGLVRAVVCGALPVLARESPLARIAGPGAPTFPLTSFEESAAIIVQSMKLTDRGERIAGLEARLGSRRDLALTFSELKSAYLGTPAAV